MSGFFLILLVMCTKNDEKNRMFYQVAMERERKNLTVIFYLLRMELLFIVTERGKNVTRNEGMTTCPEKSRVNTSSYQFYGIVGVFH